MIDTILIAMSAYGLIQVVRRLPFITRRVLDGKKPWACDACMSFWASLLVAGLLALARFALRDAEASALLAWGAAVGATFVMLTWAQPRGGMGPVPAPILPEEVAKLLLPLPPEPRPSRRYSLGSSAPTGWTVLDGDKVIAHLVKWDEADTLVRRLNGDPL